MFNSTNEIARRGARPAREIAFFPNGKRGMLRCHDVLVTFVMDKEKAPNEVMREEERSQDKEFADLLPLLRILLQEPPEGHDFATCPICCRWGITHI